MATLSASSISKSRATGLAVTGIKFRLLASFALITRGAELGVSPETLNRSAPTTA